MSPRCGWTSAWEDLMVALCLRHRRFWRLSMNLCFGISGRCKSAMRKPQHHAKPDCGRVARSTTLLPSLPGSKTRNRALARSRGSWRFDDRKSITAASINAVVTVASANRLQAVCRWRSQASPQYWAARSNSPEQNCCLQFRPVRR